MNVLKQLKLVSICVQVIEIPSVLTEMAHLNVLVFLVMEESVECVSVSGGVPKHVFCM